MALPKIESQVYEHEQPSTGENIKYRPFLVKEQKTLMMASESGDETQIRDSLAGIISSCTFEKVDPFTVPMFDVEFLFLRIRGKSVGEKVDLNVLCTDDEKTRVKRRCGFILFLSYLEKIKYENDIVNNIAVPSFFIRLKIDANKNK